MIHNQITVYSEAVRSAILATAWLLVDCFFHIAHITSELQPSRAVWKGSGEDEVRCVLCNVSGQREVFT